MLRRRFHCSAPANSPLRARPSNKGLISTREFALLTTFQSRAVLERSAKLCLCPFFAKIPDGLCRAIYLRLCVIIVLAGWSLRTCTDLLSKCVHSLPEVSFVYGNLLKDWVKDFNFSFHKWVVKKKNSN